MKVMVISNHKLLGHSLVAMLEHPDVPQDETLEVGLCDSVSAVARLRESMAEMVFVEAITNFRDGIATLRTMKPQSMRALLQGPMDILLKIRPRARLSPPCLA